MRLSAPTFLIAAVALHAAIPLVAHVVPAPEQLRIAQSFRGPMEIVEIEVAPEPEARVEPKPAETEPRPEIQPDVRPETRPAVREPTAVSEVVSPSTTSTVSPESHPAPPSTAPSTDTFDPVVPEVPTGPGGIVLAPGIGGPRAWAVPGVLSPAPTSAPAPTKPPPPRETDRNIAGTILNTEQKKKDKALGLDLPAAGTVASALGAAVRAEDTPNEGRARFAVRLSASGQVLGVSLVSSGGGSPASWDRAARAAAARLAGRALTMSSAYASGATVYVDVTSAMLMPDGTPTGGIKRQGAGASFDLSNIGARPSRQVRTSFSVVAN